MGQELLGVLRCPHCSVSRPRLSAAWTSDGRIFGAESEDAKYWGVYRCSLCGNLVTVTASRDGPKFTVDEMFPPAREAHEDIPETARRFLQQALETLHAPDAAAVMAGSAVDAMLKSKGYEKGTLYARIDEALKANLLTQGMADWAHSVRLGSNRPRHVDAENPHVSTDEAKQSVEFVEALGAFLFVLTARIDRGIAAAKSA